jgi:hypothetical protein
MDKRYAFYGQAEKLHRFYDSSWAESLKNHFPDNFNKLVDLALNKGYHLDYATKDITGWVKLADPACSEHSKPYQIVSSRKKTQEWSLVEEMTLPGVMTSIIELAKTSTLKHIAKSQGKLYRWKNMFIVPTSEWYHPLFAKDLFDIKPEWCDYNLSEEEQNDLLSEMLASGNKPPVGNDPWVVPKNHILEKYKGILKPFPAKVMKRQGKDNTIVSAYIEKHFKKGVKPEKEWNWLKYNNPKEADRLSKKYPKIATEKQWLKTNLTESQQAYVDKWAKVEELVSTDEPDDKLLARLTSEERSLVGNYFKQLNATRSRKGDKKISEYINPIVDRIKEKRPELYKHYTTKKVKTNTTHPFYDITGPGAKNEETMEQFYILAKNGADRPTNALASSLARLAGKNTRYPEFAEEIRKLRPDWFDKKLIAKDRSDRFHKRGKYKETI